MKYAKANVDVNNKKEEATMEQKILEYLTEKVIDDLRSNRFVDNELALELNRQPYIDELRTKVEDTDIDLLIKIADSGVYRGAAGLAITMIQGGAKDKKVKELLLHHWKKNNDFESKNNIMWRLLDDPGLGISMHNEIYDFVRNNLEQWIDQQVKWIGGSDEILEFVKTRLQNTDFPETKNWVYLCDCLGASDKEAAKRLIAQYADSKASIVSRVANDLLGNFDELHR